MIIQQLSIFLENKSGRLNQVLDILGKADVRIIAATVADTSEYGILRLITSDTAKARAVLNENQVSSNLSDVIAISCGSQAGTFAQAIEYFSIEGISIEYMYCFSIKEKAFLIFRTNTPQEALLVIEKHNICSISENELINT